MSLDWFDDWRRYTGHRVCGDHTYERHGVMVGSIVPRDWKFHHCLHDGVRFEAVLHQAGYDPRVNLRLWMHQCVAHRCWCRACSSCSRQWRLSCICAVSRHWVILIHLWKNIVRSALALRLSSLFNCRPSWFVANYWLGEHRFVVYKSSDVEQFQVQVWANFVALQVVLWGKQGVRPNNHCTGEGISRRSIHGGLPHW